MVLDGFSSFWKERLLDQGAAKASLAVCRQGYALSGPTPGLTALFWL